MVAYAITHSKRFRAVSGAAGDGSPCFYYLEASESQSVLSQLMGGWPGGAAKTNWEQLAPELHAADIDAPILNNDPDSEYLADLPLYSTLKELGKPMELIIYPNELHEINQPKHRYQMYERNLDWFRFWLKSEESSDPAKAQQYERWRRLREMQVKGQPN
jgi:dipeptidyl aminopeptidase/acylaminoacyl peptidase